VKRHSTTVSLPTAIIIFVTNNYVGSKEKLCLYMVWSIGNNTFVNGAGILQQEHTLLGFFFYIRVTVHHNKFLYNKTN